MVKIGLHDGTFQRLCAVPCGNCVAGGFAKLCSYWLICFRQGHQICVVSIGKESHSAAQPHPAEDPGGRCGLPQTRLPLAWVKSSLECSRGSFKPGLRRSQTGCCEWSQTGPSLVGCTGAVKTVLLPALRPLRSHALPQRQRPSAGSADAGRQQPQAQGPACLLVAGCASRCTRCARLVTAPCPDSCRQPESEGGYPQPKPKRGPPSQRQRSCRGANAHASSQTTSTETQGPSRGQGG